MKTRFISAQVLLNKDMSMKAQRVYSIPVPSVVSFHLRCEDEELETVILGVMVQEWNSRDILEFHPDNNSLFGVLAKHFGLTVKGVHHAR